MTFQPAAFANQANNQAATSSAASKAVSVSNGSSTASNGTHKSTPQQGQFFKIPKISAVPSPPTANGNGTSLSFEDVLGSGDVVRSPKHKPHRDSSSSRSPRKDDRTQSSSSRSEKDKATSSQSQEASISTSASDSDSATSDANRRHNRTEDTTNRNGHRREDNDRDKHRDREQRDKNRDNRDKANSDHHHRERSRDRGKESGRERGSRGDKEKENQRGECREKSGHSSARRREKESLISASAAPTALATGGVPQDGDQRRSNGGVLKVDQNERAENQPKSDRREATSKEDTAAEEIQDQVVQLERSGSGELSEEKVAAMLQRRREKAERRERRREDERQREAMGKASKGIKLSPPECISLLDCSEPDLIINEKNGE